MAERNADVPEAGRIVFRVGINLGDIIVEDEDIDGEGMEAWESRELRPAIRTNQECRIVDP